MMVKAVVKTALGSSPNTATFLSLIGAILGKSLNLSVPQFPP